MATKCIYCNAVKRPKKYLQWVFGETDIYIAGVLNRDVIVIYKKHGQPPGGKNINLMTDAILKLKTPWEKFEHEDHEHYRVRIKRV